MNYFLIPGNPPAVHFYELWSEEIKQFKPGARTKVSPYPLISDKIGPHDGMQDLLESHLRTLTEFYEEVKSPVTVIGHSLGGHFALKLLEKKFSWIEEVILLHPFLRRPTFDGEIILNIATLISHYPSLLDVALSAKKGLHHIFPELRFVTDEELKKAALIARCELSTIGKDQTPFESSVEHKNKITLFHSKNDRWCSSKVISDLRQSIRVEECIEPHGFVINEAQRKSLLEKILV